MRVAILAAAFACLVVSQAGAAPRKRVVVVQPQPLYATQPSYGPFGGVPVVGTVVGHSVGFAGSIVHSTVNFAGAIIRAPFEIFR